MQTNNLEIVASPNCGLMKGQCSISILIKSTNLCPFDAKLQIKFGIIEHDTKTFDEEWKDLPKEKL